MNKVLLLTTKYPCGAGEGWLTNELAECFSREGKDVSVLALSWEYGDGESAVIDLNGVKVYRSRLWKFFYKKNFICAMLKIFLFSLLVRLRYKKQLMRADLIVATTPCIVIWGLLDFSGVSQKLGSIWSSGTFSLITCGISGAPGGASYSSFLLGGRIGSITSLMQSVA